MALLPFACVLLAGAWFIAYASINDEVLHRDPLLGDTGQTLLSNGYVLMMIDTTDPGIVYHPATQTEDGSVVSFLGESDSALGVRLL